MEEGVLKWEMAGTVSEESGVGRSTEGFSSGQHCQSDNDGGMCFVPLHPFPLNYIYIYKRPEMVEHSVYRC